MNDIQSNTLPPQLNTYPVFEANQVLTNAHLNEMRDYLMEQDRLSRVYLIGMGVLSGLHLKSDMTTFVDVSSGCGITSHGYLASLDHKHLTKYRKYQDPAGYLYFKNGKVIDLWELVTADFIPDPASAPVVEIQSATDFLKNKLALIYVESYDKDLKSCLGEGCDDKGKRRIINMRVLLIQQSDLHVLTAKAQEELEQPVDLAKQFCAKCNLPDMAIKRLLLNPCPKKEEELFDQYILLCSDAIPKISASLTAAYKQFKPVLQPAGFEVINESIVTTILNTYLGEIKNNPNEKFRIQYFYDFLLDLQLAFNEFRDSIYKLALALGTSMHYSVKTARFPMHLMLGELDADNCCDTPLNRQFFLRAPVAVIDPEERNKSIFLWKRIKQMLDKFSVVLNSPVKFTPSREKNMRLSQRSIPYYYNITGDVTSLHHSWNFETEETCLSNRLLSYHSNKYNNEESITNPLKYSIDDFSFIRIEGHIGGDYELTSADLRTKSRALNLPIHVIALPISTSPKIQTGNFEFEDLQEDYFFQRNILIQFLDGVESYYNLLIKQDQNLRDALSKSIAKDPNMKSLDSLETDVIDRFKQLKVYLPYCLKDFNYEEFKKLYKQSVQDVLDYFYVDQKLFVQVYTQINNGRSGVDKIDLGNNWIGLAHKILYALINFLHHSRLYHIYYSYKLREFRSILNFPAFHSRWPGCEHQAGVVRGGTFILVYNTTGKIIADFSLPHCCSSTNHDLDGCTKEDDLKTLPIPPYAKPDYVLTFKDKPIAIKAIFNDDPIYSDSIKMKLFNGKSAELIKKEKETNTTLKNNVSLLNDGSLEYTPPTNFIGVDHFSYTIESAGNGLTDSATVTIFVVPDLKPVIKVTSPTCFLKQDATITVSIKELSGKEDLEYSIYGSGGFQKENTFTNLRPDYYQVMVRDRFTMMMSERVEVNIQEPPELTVSVKVTNTSLQGASDGIIKIDAQGGTGTLSYFLNNKEYKTNEIKGLPQGDYFVVVKDANNCGSASVNYKIVDPGLLNIQLDVSHASAYGKNDGKIYVQALTGSGSYLYSINGGVETKGPNEFTFTGLAAGVYEIVVKDVTWHLAVRKTNILVSAPKVVGPFITKWGGYGIEPGLFSHMEGITIDIKNKFVYIADMDNNRVQKFTTDGKLLKLWGDRGTNPGQFVSPTSIASHRNSPDVYVLEYGNRRIQKFTSEGSLAVWGKGGQFDLANFKSVSRIAVDTIGSLLFISGNQIHKISPAGDKVALFSFIDSGPLFDLAIDSSDNVFVSCPNDRKIFILDKLGKPIQTLAQAFSSFSLALDIMDRLYTNDFNQEIHLLRSDGTSITKFGGSEPILEPVDGLFKNIYDLAIDDSGQIYVTDFDKNVVQKFKAL